MMKRQPDERLSEVCGIEIGGQPLARMYAIGNVG